MRSTSSSSTSIITSGRALSIGGDQLGGRRDPLRRVLDRNRVGRGDRRHLADVDDDAQQIDRFLEVGVAEIERPHDRLFVLAPLGGSVGNDGERPGSRHAVEGVGGRGQRRHRVCQRRIAQVDAQRLIAKGRVEHQRDVGEAGDRQEDGPGGGAVAEDQRSGQLDAVGQLEARSGQIARAIDQRLQVGAAATGHRDLGADLLPRLVQRRVDRARLSGSARRRAGIRARIPRSARARRTGAPRAMCACAARSLARPSDVRASVLAGLARAIFVYSTTARS